MYSDSDEELEMYQNAEQSQTELQDHEYFMESVDSARRIGSITLDLSFRTLCEEISSDDFIYLANQLKYSNIENFNLSNCVTGDDVDISEIIGILKHTEIKNLNLESNDFHPHQFSALSSALEESKIEVLNLSNNKNCLYDYAIHLLIKSLPLSMVTSLNLGSLYLNFRLAQQLSDTLANTNITALNLKKCYLHDEGIKYLSTKLSNSIIQSLNLATNNMSFEGIKSLADVLENTAIRELNISRNDIDLTGAIYLAEKLSKSVVQNLDIGFNLIESAGCLAIGNVIHLTQIVELNLQGNEIDSSGITSLAVNLKESNVKHLNLSDNYFANDGAEILANGMKDSKLEYLNVDSNELSNAGIGMILDALQFTKITDFHLNCGSNAMEAENMTLVTNAFKFFKLENLNLLLPQDKNIVQIFFNELKTLIESTQPDEMLSIKNKMNFIIHLDFEIESDGVEYILDVIKHFHMKRLFFNNHYFTDDASVSSIAKMLIDIKHPISNIITLNLSRNGIKDSGAIILAENFKYLKVTRLELNDADIGNEGVIAIADELKNSQIRHLSLANNSFDSAGASYLTNSIKNHPVRILLNDFVRNGFSAEDQLVIRDINYMYLRAQLLVRAISDNSPVKYDNNTLQHLKAYEIFKNVDLLWESPCGKYKYDFNRIDSEVRSNVTKNFLKIIGVVNSDIIDSSLLPTEILIKISSYSKINDIKFN